MSVNSLTFKCDQNFSMALKRIYKECLKMSCPMIEFVLVDSPNCLGADDGRNPWGYLASRLGNCVCDPVRSRSRHRNPGKKDTTVFHPD